MKTHHFDAETPATPEDFQALRSVSALREAFLNGRHPGDPQASQLSFKGKGRGASPPVHPQAFVGVDLVPRLSWHGKEALGLGNGFMLLPQRRHLFLERSHVILTAPQLILHRLDVFSGVCSSFA